MQALNRNLQRQEEESINLRDWLFKFLSYWPLLAALLVLCIGMAWLYLRYKLPVYATTASILIKDEKKGLGNAELFNALDLFGGKKIVDNEIRVIQSRTLVRQVVKNLHLYAPVIVKGRVRDQPAYLFSPVRVAVENPDVLQAVEGLPIVYDSLKNIVKFEGRELPVNQWVKTSHGTLKFFSNPHYQGRPFLGELYFSLVPVNKASSGILSHLTVQASSKNSTVIELNIRDEVPARSEDILNELISVYNNAAIEDKNKLAGNTLQFVEERLKYVVGELDSVEGALQRFKTQNQITDISTEGQIFLETVSVNDQKISELGMQLAALNQVQDYVTGKSARGSIVPATVGVNNPVLNSLLEKFNQAELEHEVLKKQVPENHPSVVALADAMTKLRPNILENIRSQRLSLQAGKDELTVTNNRYTGLLKTIPRKERALLDISRQQAIKNNIYTFLLQKREEAAISYASTVADSRLIDRADTGEIPVSPKKNLIYLIALVAAFGITAAVVSLRDFLNTSIQGREGLEKMTGIPILGEVNFDKSGKPLVMLEGGRSFIAEQFRQLRTSLSYLGINTQHKKILVTSSVSGEGKSFICSNLAISLALAGKKVVLLELDLRKPKLADVFGLPRKTGISNYLVGQTALAEIVQPTSVENLHLLASGILPPNPSELLMNEKMGELLSQLEKDYDIILMDLPPIGPVTDALILSPRVDATLYIVRDNYTPRGHIKTLNNLVSQKTLDKVSIIYNGIKNKGWKYGYGYKEGYGYVVDEKKSPGTGWFKRINK